MSQNWSVLFVDPDPDVRRAAASVLGAVDGLSVLEAHDAKISASVLERSDVSMVIASWMPGTRYDLDFLKEVRHQAGQRPFAVLAERDAQRREQLFSTLGKNLLVFDRPWDAERLRDLVLERLNASVDAARSDRADATAKGRVASATAGTPATDPFIEFGGLTEQQIRYAKRVATKMESTLSIGEILLQLGEITREEYESVHRTRRRQLSLVRILNEDGLISDGQVIELESELAANPDRDELDALLGAGAASERAILEAVCLKHEIDYVEPEVKSIDRDLFDRTSFKFLTRNALIPIANRNGRVAVIAARPIDATLRSELERMFRAPIEFSCCESSKILEALRTVESIKAGSRTETSGGLQYRKITDAPVDVESTEKVVQIVDYLILRAIQLGASDLHVEPLKDQVRVRARIDGQLRQVTELPHDVMTRVLSRIKILASLDIAEKRLHQDGKIIVEADGAEVDIRVSTYASVYGECIVMRLLNRNKGLLTIDQIGFTSRVQSMMKDIVLPSSSGLVLVSGPTGSGKTTTMYSLVDSCRSPTEKIISAEDPVEYVLDGAIQCSVNKKSGPTFSDSLRAMMRQDPDTIIVGEVRDRETASLAVECALTGHRVFTTFHTENSVTVLIRLLEIGIEPFLVSSTINAIIAQRLVKRVCQNCVEPHRPTREELRFLGLNRGELDGQELYAGAGCKSCDGTGYSGRVGVHEVLMLDDDMREAVLRRAPARELVRMARRTAQFLTMQEDALLKTASGQTTLQEIVRAVPRDVDCRSIQDIRAIAGTKRY